MDLGILMGLMLPLLGTTLGAAAVFVLKDEIGVEPQKAMLGFASGVMIAASVWSLLIPAMDMAEAAGGPAWLPAVGGFLVGIGFLLALDMLIPHLHLTADRPEGAHAQFSRTVMLALAVALHNLPEGMAVGVVLAGMLGDGGAVSTAGALTLALGIAIQNVPEGAIISMPLRSASMSRGKAFGYGFLSGVVEPVGAVATLMLTSAISQLLPFILAFAAGAMIYVVVEELIPEAQREPHTNTGTIGVALGFALMMLLDVALG